MNGLILVYVFGVSLVFKILSTPSACIFRCLQSVNECAVRARTIRHPKRCTAQPKVLRPYWRAQLQSINYSTIASCGCASRSECYSERARRERGAYLPILPRGNLCARRERDRPSIKIRCAHLSSRASRVNIYMLPFLVALSLLRMHKNELRDDSSIAQ